MCNIYIVQYLRLRNRAVFIFVCRLRAQQDAADATAQFHGDLMRVVSTGHGIGFFSGGHQDAVRRVVSSVAGEHLLQLTAEFSETIDPVLESAQVPLFAHPRVPGMFLVSLSVIKPSQAVANIIE